jgi:tetratricopeptide (TPR) repeat protein
VPGWDEQFFGRRQELRRLDDALRRVAPWSGPERGSVVAFVHGRSGSGKSTLVRRFVQRVRLRGDALVLEGRCHERESVPFKGIDDLVDVLRRHLHARARRGEPLAPPTGASALARLFPVLGDVPGFQARGDEDGEADEGGDADVHDPVALRDVAVDALRDVLRRLADAEPLVLVLDDLQWCDPDSERVLNELYQGSGRPQALLVGSYRDEDERGGAVLAGLRARARPIAGAGLELEDVAIGPLDDGDTRALAVTLLSGREDATAVAELVAREAEGLPLLAVELARHVATLDPAQGVPALRLEAVIEARVARLPTPARRLLEAVVVAGQPLPQQVVLDACDDEARRPEALAVLRSQCFVRTQGAALEDAVEVYHDRIAGAVNEVLADEERRAWHGRLAGALERHGADDEVLATHLEGSGRDAEAADRHARAADRASRALAFNRAASLYAAALRLVPRDDERRPGLQVGLADALAHAGRGTEAGHAYLEAARIATPEQVLELRRRAAEQLLRSGRIEEGLRELRQVLRAAGLPEPSSPRRAMLGFVWRRLRIRVRGLRFDERPSDQVPAELLFRVDTCWSAATGLVQVNVIVGQSYQAHHLLLALEAGEPRRVARALAMETLYAATAGEAGAAHTDWLAREVEALAERLDDPRTRGQAKLAAGAAAVYRGRFGQAYPLLVEAEEILRTRCSDVAWELSMVRTFTVMSLYYTGQLRAMASSMERSLKDAAARDDLHTALMLRVSYGPIEYLAADDLEGARTELADCQVAWPDQLARSTFLYVAVLTDSRIARYAGDGAAAWLPFERWFRDIERSLMLERPPLRIFMLHDKGCAAALAAHGSHGDERTRFLRRAEGTARRLEREPGPWGAAMAAPIVAALQAADGSTAEARCMLEAGIAAFELLGMQLYAHAASRRLGELLGGEDGRARIERADTAMRAEGIASPERMAGMLVPPVLGWTAS